MFMPAPRASVFAAQRIVSAILSPPLIGSRAANDNAVPNEQAELILREALEVFARHGLGAAHHAFEKAETAHSADDTAAFAHWSAVTRALDRRMGLRLRAPSS